MNNEVASTRSLPDASHILSVDLEVADLDRSVGFYTDVIGMRLLREEAGQATLGAGGRPLVELHEIPGADPVKVSATGLYHLAILVGSRVELGRSLARLVERGYPLGGASDHLVSEALYLSDPDGNGIEIYRDRPRDDWQTDGGNLRMDTLPLDLRALLDDARRATRPWTGLADDATIGHIHLQVDDLATARAFYGDGLGFDVMVDFSRMGALFLSAGGYHHHIGLNIWHSRNGSPRPVGTAGLRSFGVDVVTAEALGQVTSRLRAGGTQLDDDASGFSLMDPAGNTVRLIASNTQARS